MVGLGNPGARYASTRHNLGAMAVEALGEALRCRFREGRGAYRLAEARGAGGDQPLLLARPTSYMNLSGKPVRQLLAELKAEPGELMLVTDDFYLPLGRTRLRPSGGAGGHNGIASVIEQLGTDAFPRLRMGIGEPPAGEVAADWVLEPFLPEERPEVERMIERTVEASLALARGGLSRAMDVANRRPVEEER